MWKYVYLFLLQLLVYGELSSKADQMLSMGVNSQKGLAIATDLWNGPKLRDINPLHKENLLGTSFQLESGGTNLDISLVVSIFEGKAVHPEKQNIVRWIWVEVNGTKANTDDIVPLGEIYYGRQHDTPPYIYDGIDPLLVKKTLLYRLEDCPITDSEGNKTTLSIIRLDFSVPLYVKTDRIPEEVNIDAGVCLGIWKWSSINKEKSHNPTVAELKSIFEKSGRSETVHKTLGPNTIVSAAKISSTQLTATNAMPEVTLSISRKNGYLLIIFSPAVTNATLEEANPNSYPWVWQNSTATNNANTNGWNVVPTEESRIFRVKLNQ